ncbi:GIY-YIG nuclease family protein [Bradyrhizobium sp. Ai1a-2]|uniref:GIY-YIG nuclease family protein n=1 Tax=Bradyrhizobium sp. Ai1a-2 TaxID=196490 RepID=UPI00040D42EE|nr:GIY-YIG nuclease family protein [Bradyrhizobium sp. Ai1a-2]
MSRPLVYFAQAGDGGPIKIGFTSADPSDRIAALQTGCPTRISLLGYLAGSKRDEAGLHRRYSYLHLSGEWFRADESLIEAIGAMLQPEFQWPPEERVVCARALPLEPTISDIIWAAGGPSRIAEASKGEISVDAIHKWRRNGIRDWHWALLMSLCDVSVDQLYRANLTAADFNRMLEVA